jgi:hypothetical protein
MKEIINQLAQLYIPERKRAPFNSHITGGEQFLPEQPTTKPNTLPNPGRRRVLTMAADGTLLLGLAACSVRVSDGRPSASPSTGEPPTTMPSRPATVEPTSSVPPTMPETTAPPTATESPEAPFATEVAQLISDVSTFVAYRSDNPQERNIVDTDDGERIIINTGTHIIPGTRNDKEYGLYVVGFKRGDQDNDASPINTITVGKYRGQFANDPSPVDAYTLTIEHDESYTIGHIVDTGKTYNVKSYTTRSQESVDREAFKARIDDMERIFAAAQSAKYSG